MILHHEFIKTAKRFGKKLAIDDQTTGKKLSFEKSLIAALILAKKFKKFREGYIGLMIPNSAGSYLSILGILMAGKVPVMINYSTGAADNCEYAQDKCAFKTIITSRSFLEKTRTPLVPGMIFIEDIMEQIKITDKLKAALKSKLSAQAVIRSLPKSDPDDDVVILFTSGSEKEPKAVQLTHKNIGSNVINESKAFDLNDKDIILGILPLFHVFGQNINYWLPMTQGMTTITYANPLDYKKIPKLVKEGKVTLMAGTPVFFGGYLRESDPGDFSSISIMIAGADKCPDWLREGYQKKHNIELLEGYGCTETSPVISANTPTANKPGSIGKPMPGVDMKIIDLSSGKTLGANQEGKITVKGDLVMKGYLGNLEETSMRIKDGWYDTGDMGKFDNEGYFWHLGRLKRFAKVGGEMVSLVKTESVLEEILPVDVECCVVEIPDTVKGAKIIAVITTQIDERQVRKQMQKQLPVIGIPKQFIIFPELPKMGSGKLDFRSITHMVKQQLL